MENIHRSIRLLFESGQQADPALKNEIERLVQPGKKTTKALADLEKLQADASALEPQIQEALADDKTDPAALAKTIGEKRALMDVLHARRLRARDGALALLVSDIDKAIDRLAAERQAATARVREARESWRNMIRESHGNTAESQRLLDDATLHPKSVRQAEADDTRLGHQAWAMGIVAGHIDSKRIAAQQERNSGVIQWAGQAPEAPEVLALRHASQVWPVFAD